MSRLSRWLHEQRLRLALGIALVEGLFVALGEIGWLPAIVVAAAVVATYFWVGRRLRPGAVRELAWVAALSQAFVALVPVLVIVIGTLALIAVGVLALAAVLILLAERR